MNRIFFGERITRVQLIALLLTYMGIGIAYYDEMRFDTDNPNFFPGKCAGIFMFDYLCVVYSGSGKIIPYTGAMKFTAYSMLAATLGIFVHYFVRGNYETLQSTGEIWGYGILLAILATVIPTFLLSAGMLRIGSNNAAIVSSIGPVSTILQAHWILGERINTGQIIGTVLVIGGVLLTGWKSQATAE